MRRILVFSLMFVLTRFTFATIFPEEIEPTFEPLVAAPLNGEEIARSLIINFNTEHGLNVTLGNSKPVIGYGYGADVVGYAFIADSDTENEEIITHWDEFYELVSLEKDLVVECAKYHEEYFSNPNCNRSAHQDEYTPENILTDHINVNTKLSLLRLYLVLFIKDGPVIANASKLPYSLHNITVPKGLPVGYNDLGYCVSYTWPVEVFRDFPQPQLYQLYRVFEVNGELIYNIYEDALNMPFYSVELSILSIPL